MLSLPTPPASPNEVALASWKVEEFTGLTVATITLAANADAASGMVLVWKNGTLLRPSLNTISANVITLPSALIAGDWVVVVYHSRR